MEKFIFLADVDGTLLRGDSGISMSAVKAAQAFMEAGGLLGLCTGRATISARWVAKELGVNMPCILYNGAAIYNFETEECVWSRAFENDILQILDRIYHEFPDLSIQAYTQNEIFILRTNKRLNERGIKEENNGTLSDLSQISGDILKLVLTCDDVEKLVRCYETLFSSSKYVFAFSSSHFAEVVPYGAGKDHAMEEMAQQYHVDLSHFFVAGDGMTDLPMIKLGGYTFAPSTSPQVLLEVCDMVIPSCEEGGMEKAFFVAIEKMLSSIEE